ncbi:PadR family transcriptional regulator [Sulfuracidifex tepidarius]|nr:PadR family transcriptional regulator [Sulfuracidifex tepidarius]
MLGKLNLERLRKGVLRYLVMESISEKPLRVYDIIKSIEERFDGTYRPSTGSIYPILKGLVDEGLVEVNEKDGKKTYVLNQAGKQELEKAREKFKTKFADDYTGDKRKIALELMDMIIILYGNRNSIGEEETKKILEIIRACREKIEVVIGNRKSSNQIE